MRLSVPLAWGTTSTRRLSLLAIASALQLFAPVLLAQTGTQPLISVTVSPGSSYSYGCCETHPWPSLNLQVKDVISTSSTTYATATVHVHVETSDTNPNGWADVSTTVSFDFNILGSTGDQYRLTWDCTVQTEADGYVPGSNLPTIFYQGCGIPNPSDQGNFNHTATQSGVINGTISRDDPSGYVKVATYGQNLELSQGGHRSEDWVFNVSVQIFRKPVLVDPVPDLLCGAPAVVDTAGQCNSQSGADLLATGGQVIQGVSADGVSEVLIRVTGVNQGDQITFSILNDQSLPSGSADEDGALGNPGDMTFSQHQLTVSAIQTSSGPQAFAVYRAPIDFVRSNPQPGSCNVGITSGDDSVLTCRGVTIQAQFPGGGMSTTPVTIVRPPVMLIHGIWSSRDDTWGKFSPFYRTQGPDARFSVSAANYDVDPATIGLQITDGFPAPTTILNSPSALTQFFSTVKANSLGFRFNAETFIIPHMQVALTAFKTGGNPAGIQVASIQTDIVGHSMGGDIARTLPLEDGFFSATTFGAGIIHKLITIDTPHLGTPLANELQRPENSCTWEFFAGHGSIALSSVEIGGVTVAGAAGDLEGDGFGGGLNLTLSEIHKPIGTYRIPAAFIAAKDGSVNRAGLDVCLLCAVRLVRAMCSTDPIVPFMTSENWPHIFDGSSFQSPGDDGIVPFYSQVDSVGNTYASTTFNDLVHSPGTYSWLGLVGGIGFIGPSVVDDPAQQAAKTVIDLLNTPVTDQKFHMVTP